MFKKVIGQDQNEANRPVPTPPPAYKPEVPAAPAAAAPSHTPTYSAPAAAASASPGVAATRNVLSSDVEIKGSVKFSNDLVVDGRIEGEITSDGNLTVGENARIRAEIKTGTVVIYGKVHGNITVTDRVDLKASAEVVGDIKAKTLSIEAGAIFVGKSTVGTPANVPAAPASGKSSPEAAKQGTLTGTGA